MTWEIWKERENKFFLKILSYSRGHVVISVTILVKGTPRVSLENVILVTVSLLVNGPLIRVGILGYLLLSLQTNQVTKDLKSAQGSKERNQNVRQGG